ncbi:MAG: hypothetical protein LC791_13690, partial [Acidobacteria bacterium]|nr:hypothetical protein [Acidobacteriota bacterium]
LTAMSAPPYNVTTGVDSNGDRDINERPLDANGTMISPFSARGDSYFSIDLRASKSFTLGRPRFEVLFEMFNVLNTTNYGGYDGNMASQQFGRPRFALPPFQGQLGLRLDF